MQVAQTNHFLRLARFVRRRLQLASHFCLVCHVPTPIVSVKPFVCSSQLCLHQWGELSLGASPEDEVATNPEVVDLLLSLVYKHAVSGFQSEEQAPRGQDHAGRATGGLFPTWQTIRGWV
eukprot:SAG31_NODE_548_length_14222_cov_10.926574_13_plen_120_part_00